MINKRKYEQLLNNTIKEINKDDKKTINELLTYVNENKPKSLFHYRSCTERSIEAFRENKIYFNTASNFNDPYDCLIYCDIEYILKQIQNMFDYENIEKLNNNSINLEKVFYTTDAIAAATAIKVSRNILKKWINEGKVVLKPYQQLKEIDLDNKEEINSEVANKIKNIMANIIEIKEEDIPSDAHFIYDLGATSLDYLTLLVKLREEFEMDFNFTDNNNCYNVEEFVKYITK